LIQSKLAKSSLRNLPKVLDSPILRRYFHLRSHHMSKFLFSISIYVMALATGLSFSGRSCAAAENEVPMDNIDTEYVRPPAVAGSFYPGSPSELAKMLAGFFHAAPKPNLAGKPLAIIAPHAGYVYSGAIAARAYKILEGETLKTVIVISPSHTVYFKGVSVFGGKAYSTPLGDVPIDRELTDKIAASGGPIAFSNQGHSGYGRAEHALEVQLPFLQVSLGKFSLVALVMGDQNPSICMALGKAIAKAVGKRDDVLIVASSDLSHFHDQSTASRLDSVIAGDVGQYDYEQLAEDLGDQKTEACGGGPIIAAMIAAKEMGANKAQVTGLGDSAPATGDKSNVVGYLSAVIYKEEGKKAYEIREDQEGTFEDKSSAHSDSGSAAEFGLSPGDKKTLLSIARQAIKSRLEGKTLMFPKEIPSTLSQPLGAFVTLSESGDLRGCIGTFQPRNPLYEVVAEMARQAAFSDYRFPPIQPGELEHLDIEISVLTPMKRIYNPDSVEVGRDGLYVRRGQYSGVLLPQVPVEQRWDRTTFLDHTCLKAGLPSSSWRNEQTELYVFQAEIFSERQF
jgi:AmmeMemoRadiSam system protein B/AmmeMemoRadiSam system protein A